MAEPDLILNFDVEPTPGAFEDVQAKLMANLGDAMKSAGVTGGTLEAVMKKAADAITKAQKSANAASKGTADLGMNMSKMGREASTVSKMLQSVAKDMKAVKDSATLMAAGVQRVGIDMTQSLNRQTFEKLGAQREAGKLAAIEAQRSAQMQLIAERSAGSQRVIEAQRIAQQQVIAAREGAQQRVQVTRFVLESIGRLEKALGATVTGIARTTTSALSATFSKIGSLFHRSNSDMTSGLNGALNQRESTLRGSFRQQERIISESVTRQERSLAKFRAMSSTGVTGAVTGRGIGGGILGIGVGYGIASTLKKGYTDAVNLGEQLNKNRVVFGSYAEDLINFFVKGAPQALGQTEAQVLEATGTFGNLFKNLGLGERDVFNFSTSLTALASDLASFNNTPVDEALTALRAGLTGESEPLKKFGIDVSDAALKHEAMLLGISDGRSVLDAATKAQAAYSLIIKSAGDAQYDFARTADAGANAARIRQASIAQLASTIMGYFVPVVTRANVVIGKMADSLSRFISGDLSEGFKTLRTGLVGVAVALGALLAAKAGIEVFQLLGATVGAALTPMGLLIVAAAGIGAAIAIAWKRSAEFRDGVIALRDRLGELIGVAGGGLSPVLDAIGNIIETKVIPAFDRAASFVGRNLVGAFNAAYNFVSSTLIPGLAAAGRFIASTFAPIIVGVATTVANALTVAAGAVVRFAARAQPYLQPAINGFRDLGQAISDAFGGDFSKLGSGIGSMAAGIGASAGKVGALILSVLAPIGTRIWSFLTGMFSAANVMKLAGGFLDLVEQIGRILGSIVSDPRLIAALGAIAGVAAIIALRFAKGLVEGIVSNIPDLLAGASGLLAKAFAAAIANPAILGKAILAVLGVGALYALLVRPLQQAFTRLGGMTGSSFTAGFKASMANQRSFVSTLFGGMGAANAANDSTMFSGMRTEAADLQRTIRALGSSFQVVGDARGLEAAREKAALLKQGLTDTQVQALILRDRFIMAGQGAATMATGALGGLRMMASGLADVGRTIGNRFSNAMRGVADNLSRYFSKGTRFESTFADGAGNAAVAFQGSFRDKMTAGWANIRQSFTQGLAQLREAAAGQGAVIGRTLATGALLAFGSYTAGKAEGASGGSGATSAIMSGLTAGLLVMQTTNNAYAGAAAGAGAAAAALLGTQIGKAKKEAQDAKKRIEDLAKSLRDRFATAVSFTTDRLISMADVLSGAGMTAENNPWASVREVTDEWIGTLTEAGVSWSDVQAAFRDGAGAVDDLGRRIMDNVGDAEHGIDAAKALKTAYEEVAAAAAMATRELNYYSPTTFSGQSPYANPRGVDDTAAGGIQAGIDATNQQRAHTSAVQQYVQSRLAAHQADLDQAHDTAMQEMIDNQAGALDRVQQAADDAKAAIDAAFGVRDAEGFQAAVDAAVLSLRGSFAEVKVGEGTSLFDEASLRTQLDGFRQQLADVAQQGIADGTIFDQASLTAKLLPVLASVLDGVDDQGLRDQITTAFNDGIASASPVLTQQQFDDLAAGLSEDGLTVDVKIDPTQASTEVHDALHTSGAKSGATSGGRGVGIQFASGMAGGIGAGQAAIVAAARRAARAAEIAAKEELEVQSPSRVMFEVGEFVAEGLADGIDAGAPLADAAAARLGRRLITSIYASDNPLRGKVLLDMTPIVKEVNPADAAFALAWKPVGTSIGQAIVDGIADKADDIGGAAASAAQAAVNGMRFGGDKVKQGVNAGTAALFGGMTGTDSVGLMGSSGLIGANALGQITSATQSFLSGFDSNVSQIFEVNAKKLKDLTAADREVYGTNVFSLDASTAFGSSNVQAVTGVLDNIAAFAQDLIAQGTPLGQVTGAIHDQVEAFIALATNLGFNGDQIRSFVDALGLSDDALAKFVGSSKDLTAALSNPPTPKDDKETTDTAETTVANEALPRQITNYIVVPYGDPNAIALTVANQQAYDMRLP